MPRAIRRRRCARHRLPTGVLDIAIDADGTEVYAACMDGVYRLNVRSGEHRRLTGHRSYSSGVVCLPADGTFYCFPHVQDVIDRLEDVKDDVQLAAYLLDKAGVALVPGSAFGAPGYVRVSFATGMDVLKDALGRIASALTV